MTYRYTYFLDRALGKSVGEALQALGVNLEFHHDHFDLGSPNVKLWKNKTKLSKTLLN